MLAPITFSGLATGLDTSSIIEQLLFLERQPIRRLEDRQDAYSSQASKLRSLKTKLTALADAAEGLSGRDDVLATTVGSSDDAVMTASVTGSPAIGPTTIDVTSLATAEKTYSDAFSAKDTAGLFGAGTLSIQVGADAAVDVTIDGADTLETVVGKINASGANVTAGLVFDGTDYRLRVTGNETGAANGVVFTETGTSLGLDDPANEVQAAADAVFTVDGFAMTRDSNTVSDAIPGVAFTLTGAGSASLEVQRDPDAVRESAQSFVDTYNDVMRSINAEFAYTGAPRGPESLSGDSTLRGLQSALRSMVGGTVAGTSGAYTTLASVGVSTQTDGTLQLEAGELDAALADDPSAVADLFAGDGAAITGFVASFDDLIEQYVDSGGILTNRIDSLDGRQRDIDDQIDRLELRVGDAETRLREQFATLEQLVSGLQNQGNQMMAALGGLGAG